ncbi:hypothetical protein [Photobacterium leiognathi]|uniref:hypothetical protein n=1 Tax=Photobacterium leiognathi TaxID=553611 RepID=UPI002739C7AB|nr:hypothetical protein [Photobacterium leiognathi]
MTTTTDKPTPKAMLGKALNLAISLLSSLSFYGTALTLLTFVLSLWNKGVHGNVTHNSLSIAFLLVLLAVFQWVFAGILKLCQLPIAKIGSLTLKQLTIKYMVIAAIYAGGDIVLNALFSNSLMLLNIMTLVIVVVCFVYAITFENDRRGLDSIKKSTKAN